ncbi:MAG: hypothetical protein AAGN46_18700, partial [Acidobacteriota bacterium]
GTVPALVRVERSEARRLEIQVDAERAGWLVLADRYSSLWRARVDNRPTPFVELDLKYRGVAVPPGRSHVVVELNDDFDLGTWLGGGPR